jgi:PAS domain S-box-containing protein
VPTPLLAELGIGRLFDLVPDAVVVGDVAAGRVVAWNSAATALFGYDADTALGMALELLVPTHLREAHLAGLARYAAGGGGHLTGSGELIELPALRADATELWVELRLAALEGEGQRDYVVAVFRDITARRAAQDEAARALNETQRVNASLRDFVAMAAHDIRSPVAGVAMALQMLERRWDDLREGERVQMFQGAQRHTAFVTRLLDDLLDVSSLDAGELASSPIVCDLARVVAEAALAGGVDVDVPAGLLVFADPAHVQRVIANLVSNADKYGRPPVRLTAIREPGFIELAVEDSGDGVDEELLPRMFDKFARGSGSSTGKPGAGLGLAIVSGLVRANGGDVRYESGAAGGSRFICTLPAATTPEQRAH